MKSGKVKNAKLSKRNRLLLNILLVSIAVVFCLIGILVYLNYYSRVRLVLTAVNRYKTGEIKSVTEYEVIDVKKGRTLPTLPAPYMEGYTFVGWYKDIDYKFPFDYNAQLTEHMQIYGRFDLVEYNVEIVLDDNKKIVYNANQNIDYTQAYTIEDRIYFPKHNDIVKLNDDTEISIDEYKRTNKYGYTFEGWGLSTSATTTYTDSIAMRAQNLTFYAVWKPIQVELRYKTLDLDFTGDKISQIRPRIDSASGGLTYNGRFETYMDLRTEFNQRVDTIPAPVDAYGNFKFSGWFLDPNFIVPLKTSQLYIKNGYLTMARDRDINILDDELYFDTSILTPAQRDTIKAYSSTDEKNSYVTLFAKWTLQEYTIKFDLNIPHGNNYIDTSGMTAILNHSFNSLIYSDDGTTLKRNVASQGWKIFGDDLESGVLYNENYFKDVVYRTNDPTGLPLYTILSWNTQRDGSGYNMAYGSTLYFDKDNFRVLDGEITLYAQWKSYHRINYYYIGDDSSRILLGTVNVGKNTISLPSFNDLVMGVGSKGNIQFTDDQIRLNKIERTYNIPFNKSFIGWMNSTTFISGFTNIYVPNYTYTVGNIRDDQGIYLNSAEKNLYTIWLANDNYYTYDMGENADGINYSSETNIKASLFDESGNQIVHHYDRTKSSYTLATVKNEKYQVSKTDNGTDYILWGWKLKDGYEISGQSTIKIEFNSNRPEFVYNLANYTDQMRNISTEVYIVGKVLLDTDTYYTIYNDVNDRSYIYLKIPARLLTFEAVWMENIVVSFKAGADDVEWLNGHNEDELTMLGAGDLYMTMPDLPKSYAKRPFYEFVGWSEKNREELGINYNEFVRDNTIYNAGQKYPVFSSDKTLYAVWKPVVFSLNINQLAMSSSVNYSAGVIYISKEKFTDGLKNVTDEVLFSGNIVSYVLADGIEKTITLNTSAVVGYGLAGWANSSNVELVKSGTGYAVSVLNDENHLFIDYPTSNQTFINIYPIFNILKFTVTFKFDGVGINKVDEQIVDDIGYGTSARSLLSRITMPTYKSGYEYAGWKVSGDKASDGTIRPEYIVDLKTSNLLVKSDIVLSLHAIIQSFSVRFIYNNPATNKTVKVSNYTIDYYDTLDSVMDEVNNQLSTLNFVGYNFNYWTVAGGGSSQSLSTLEGLRITCPYDIYPTYTSAELTLVYNYYSENSSNPDKLEQVKVNTYVGYGHTIVTGDFAVKPIKTDCLLAGWQVGDKVYKENDSLPLTIANIGDYIIERVEGGVKKYTLNIDAKWSEAVKLAFDLTGVTISVGGLPDELIVGKGDKLYFKNIGNISKLTKEQVTRDNGYGVFTGKWEDQFGKQYDAYLSSTYIQMDTSMVLKPVFEAQTYVINYYYRMSNKYSVLASATQSITADYNTPLNLHDKATLVNFIHGNYQLTSYDCVGLYLTKSAFESGDSSFAIAMGSAFDFANNAVLMALAENYNFKIYMDLRKFSTIEYYSDRQASSARTAVNILEGSEYIIGTSDLSLTQADIVPSKDGYTFLGWSTSLISQNVEFRNGEIITYNAQFVRLYPVWDVAKAVITYHNNDGTTIYLRETHNCFENFNLLGDTGLEGYKLIGWATTPNATVAEYEPNASFVVNTTDDVNFYAIWEKYYTIYYYNNLGDKTTLDEHIVTKFEFIPANFADTKLSEKIGSEFLGWSLDPVNPVLITSLMINSRNGLTVYLREGTITMDSADDYNLKLYAYWKTSYYSAKFMSYDNSGNATTYYGVAENPTSLSTTEKSYEFNETNSFVFSFPTTANYYEVGGVTYKFDGTWKDENGKIYTGTVSVVFNKNHTFTPVYKMVISLVFANESTEIYRTDDYLSGDKFNLNESALVNALKAYNTGLTGKAIIGWSLNGNYYSHLGAGDHGYNYHNWLSTLTVNSSATLEAVVVDLINVNVFKSISYDETTNKFTFDMSSMVVVSGCVVGDYIDLSTYFIDGDYKTLGYVVNGVSDYVYNPNVEESVLASDFTIDESMMLGTYTLYAYPVIGVKVNYAVDVIDNIVKTDFIVMGTSAPNIDYVLGENYYLGNWQLDGSEYNGESIVKPVTLLALAMPYYTLQMDDPERRIDESLLFKKLTPNTKIVIPNEEDASYDRVGLTLLGWYIRSIGSNEFVMNGSNRRVFKFNEEITIQTLIDLGYPSSNYTYGLVPIFNYTFEKLTLANVYEAITYTISAGDGRTYYTINANGNYEFYLVKNSSIIASDTQLSFVGCMVADGKMVTENYNDVKAVVTISRHLTEGYESYVLNDGWYYYPENVKTGTNIAIGSALTITASMPTANDVSASVGIANTQFNAVYDTSMAYFGEEKTYEYTSIVKAGTLVSVAMTLQDGYEFAGIVLNGSMTDITTTFNGTINISNNVVTVNFRVNNSERIYLVVRPNENVKLTFKLNSAMVSDYSANKFSGTISIYYDDNFKWTLLESFDIDNIKNGTFTTTKTLKADTKVKVVVEVNSVLYYVKTITLTGTNNDTAVNTHTIEDVKVSLKPVFEITLLNRTYTIVDESGKELVAVSTIGDTIAIPFPTAESKANMVFGGYKMFSGNTSSDATFRKFVTSATTLNSDVVVGVTTFATQQNVVVVLKATYRTMSYNVTVMGESGKSLIDGNVSKTYRVPYGSTITANANTLQMKVGEYSFTENGEISSSSVKNTIITLLPVGSYVFDKWVSETTIITTLVVSGNVTINGVVKAGKLNLNTTFNAVADSDGQLNTTAMLTVRLYDGIGADRTFTYGNINTAYTLTSVGTGSTFAFAVVSESGFNVTNVKIIYNNIDSSNFANLTEFANSCGIEITVEAIENGNKYSIKNAIYDVNVICDVARKTYDTKIMLIESTQSSDALNTLYASLKDSGEKFADYVVGGNTSNITFTETTIINSAFRKTIKVGIVPNQDYFEIDKIYVNGVDVGTLSGVSFDITNNTLSLYAGGNNGTDQMITVAVKFKVMKVVFHKPDMSEFNGSELSGSLINPNSKFEFNSSISLSDSSFEQPKNIVVINGKSYKFVSWKYYNGNYELDQENSSVDMSKLSNIGTLNYTFSLANGNLHLFGEWANLYAVKFDTNGDNVSNMPSDINNLLVTDGINLSTIPTRTGFNFAGYFYVYNGETYYLNYNSGFEKLVDSDGNVVAVNTDAILSDEVLINQLITTAQLNDDSASAYTLTLQAKWVAKQLSITLNYDPNMCDISQEVYQNVSYVAGNITFNYLDNLVVYSSTLDGKTTTNIMVYDYLSNLKGRVVITPKTNDNYELKEVKLNGKAISSASITAETNIIDVVCWGSFVEHNLDIEWDKLYSDAIKNTHYGSLGGQYGGSTYKYALKVSYTVYDIATKLGTSENVFTLDMIRSDSSVYDIINESKVVNIYDNFDISKLAIKLRKGYGLKVVFDLTNTPYFNENTKTYTYVNENLSESTGAIKFNLESKNVVITSNFVNSDVTDFGNVEVIYYTPNIANGVVADYTMQTINVSVSSGSSKTISVVTDSEITFNYSSNDYVLKNVNSNIVVDNSATIVSGFDNGQESYTLKFDYKYIDHSFKIANVDYAKAYFRTTDSNKLKAFYKLVTYGFNSLDSATLSVLASDVSNVDNMSNILKTSTEYYTVGELIGTYRYSINENYVYLYSNGNSLANDLKNIWFEEWLLESTFGTGASEDNIAVSGLTGAVTINAGYSRAVWLTYKLEGDETGERAGINFLNNAGLTYYYNVINSTTNNYEVDGNRYFSKIVLRVKDNTYLPHFELSYTTDYYVKENSTPKITGKIISTSNNGSANYYTDGLLEVELVSKIAVKELTLNVTTNVPAVGGGTVAGGSVKVTFATTYAQVLTELKLQLNYYLDDINISNYYSILGFYVENEKIDNDLNFEKYFDLIGEAYTNGNTIDVVVRYLENVKKSITINSIKAVKGVNAGELGVSKTIYVVANTAITGTYSGNSDYVNNGFMGVEIGSYRKTTVIKNTTLYFGAKTNNLKLVFDEASSTYSLVVMTTTLNTMFSDFKASEYTTNFSGLRFVYYSTNANDDGCKVDASGLYYVKALKTNSTNTSVMGGSIVRQEYTSVLNDTIVVGDNVVLYAVYVPEISVTVSSENYTDLVGNKQVSYTRIEGAQESISSFVTNYYNVLISDGIDIGNLEADYVLINGTKYNLFNEKGGYNYITVSGENLDIQVVWKEIE